MDGQEFDELVDFFDGMVRTNWLSEIHRKLKEESGSWANKAVADIGCGTGRLLLRGISEANELAGVDLSAGMVQRANGLFQAEGVSETAKAIVGDAMDLPLARDHYDLVFSTCVLFLLPDPQQGIKELSRILKPKGTLFLLNPAPEMDQKSAEAYANKHNFSELETVYLLKWATVSERRHRKSKQQLNEMLFTAGIGEVVHFSVLDGLGLISRGE
ncbi:class I SAM-dependent methyltransferase [Bacillus sp. JCM 19041]|uniref:class I SAM-dependent methyltransferase n=1 Tax=Bacillus sp. JCM 19041 TaxID=1460637 RepID=UPI00336A6311